MTLRRSVRLPVGMAAVGVLALWVQRPAGGAQDWHAAIPIAYLGSRRVGGQTWIRVRLDLSAGCGEPDDRVSPVRGWIPALRSSGEPSAWFYSRGC